MMTTPEPDPRLTRRPPNRGAKGGRPDAERLTVRLLPDERARLVQEAQDAGQSLAGLARTKLLGGPGPRAKRSPTVNAVLLAQTVAQLNKIGSNINQIAHAINGDRLAGRSVPSIGAAVHQQVLGEVRQAVADIRSAVGRESHVSEREEDKEDEEETADAADPPATPPAPHPLRTSAP
jgi:hypothetical protein